MCNDYCVRYCALQINSADVMRNGCQGHAWCHCAPPHGGYRTSDHVGMQASAKMKFPLPSQPESACLTCSVVGPTDLSKEHQTLIMAPGLIAFMPGRPRGGPKLYAPALTAPRIPRLQDVAGLKCKSNRSTQQPNSTQCCKVPGFQGGSPIAAPDSTQVSKCPK